MSLRRIAWLALLAASAAHGAGAPEPSPEAVVATLPFAPSREVNRVMVDLAPEGGRPFVMMLDTGASISWITPRMARELGVRVRSLKNDLYRRPTRLGRDLQFWVDTQNSDSASRTGWEYALLGGNFMDDYVVEIDFPKQTVRFLDPKRYQVPDAVDDPSERTLAVKIVASRVLVPIEINGHALEVLLDTGAPATTVLSGQAAREAGIDVDALPKFGRSGTTVGPMDTSLYEEAAFGFAGFGLGTAPVQVAPKGWYNIAGSNDSVVGYDVLAPFVVRIDYPHKRLWLKRVHSDRIRFYGADYALAKQTGAYMSPVQSGYAVWAVTPGSAAAKLGVRPGDVVVSSESDAPPPPDEVLHRILEGKELQVARQQGELWVDTVLPEESPAPDAN
jgi:hypothetical protein